VLGCATLAAQRGARIGYIDMNVILNSVNEYKKASDLLDKNIENWKKEGFDVCIIDEAAQATEAICWIPILISKKLILAGDHKQLPPTVKSIDKDVIKILENTLFNKLIEKFGNKITKMLLVQYRMNELIMKWPSLEF
jgi:superfamily I DNA and/or RNA helicase